MKWITMSNCVSCKNKSSSDRCERKAIKGLTFCGTHAKMKIRRDWFIVNNVNTKVIKIQTLWRGFNIRNLLKHLGPGVLKRSICHNEEELISLEPISKLNPFHYFSFEENGKIWAFDRNSIFTIIFQNEKPINPYTRQLIPQEARRRMRWYMRYLSTNKETFEMVPRTNKTILQLNQISQILHENGFDNFRVEYISTLSSQECIILKSLLWYDMKALAVRASNTSKLHNFVCSLNPGFKSHKQMSPIKNLVTTIFFMLALCSRKDEYDICFLIMSALFRI